jgi:hypothetical protein
MATKYYTEYAATGNTRLLIEDYLYLNKEASFGLSRNGLFGVGKSPVTDLDVDGQIRLTSGQTYYEGELRYKDTYLWVNTGGTANDWKNLIGTNDVDIILGRGFTSGAATNSGEFQGNSSTITSISSIQVNYTDNGGVSCDSWLKLPKAGDTLYLSKKTDNNVYGIYTITSITTGATYVTYGVANLDGAGTTAGGVSFILDLDFGVCSVQVENNVDNRILTATGGNTINGERYLTFTEKIGVGYRDELNLTAPDPLLYIVGAAGTSGVVGGYANIALLSQQGKDYPSKIEMLKNTNSSALSSGDSIGTINFRGYNGSNYENCAIISTEAGEGMSNEHNGTILNIKTINTTDKNTPQTRLQIDEQGNTVVIVPDEKSFSVSNIGDLGNPILKVTDYQSVGVRQVDIDCQIGASTGGVNITGFVNTTLDVYCTNLNNDGRLMANLQRINAASYTGLTTDYTIISEYSAAGNPKIYLPDITSSSDLGRIINIKNATGSKTLTVEANTGDTIVITSGAGVASFNIATNGYSVTLQSDGVSKWYVIGALAATSF